MKNFVKLLMYGPCLSQGSREAEREPAERSDGWAADAQRGAAEQRAHADVKVSPGSRGHLVTLFSAVTQRSRRHEQLHAGRRWSLLQLQAAAAQYWHECKPHHTSAICILSHNKLHLPFTLLKHINQLISKFITKCRVW